MKAIDSQLLGNYGPSGSRIKVTWRMRVGWFERVFLGWPSHTEHTATYVGRGVVWRVMPSFQRVHPSMESKLADIEAKLVSRATGQVALV